MAGVSVCFEDSGVAKFGLHNALVTIGDQSMEVVSPTTDGTTAGRLLDKRGGNGGFTAIYEVDDLDSRTAALEDAGLRIVWRVDLPDIRTCHLHPARRRRRPRVDRPAGTKRCLALGRPGGGLTPRRRW